MSRLSNWVNKPNDWFWSRVVASTRQTVQSVAIFRLLTGLFLLFFYTPGFQWIGQIPSAFYNPPLFSPAFFFQGFPPAETFLVLDILVLVSILCILLGVRARLFTRLFVVFSVIGYSFQYSLGKIDHNILLLVMLACMSFSGWGTQLALVPDKKKASDSLQKSVALLAVLLCFGFFTAGFEKALNWLNVDLSRSGSAFWYQSGFYAMGRTHLLAPLGEKIPLFVFKLMDYCAVLFELIPFVCLLLSRRAWIAWLSIACIFHLVNLLLLNIPFFLQAIIYLAFLDYTRLYSFVSVRPKLITSVFLIAGAGFFIRMYDLFMQQSSTILFVSDQAIEVSLWIYLFGWILIVIGFAKIGFSKPLNALPK